MMNRAFVRTSIRFKRSLLFALIVFSSFQLKAQQNLFNIPSGDITEKNKHFYQHQLNVYTNQLESKSHWVYGLGNGWDAGINLVGKSIYFGNYFDFKHNDSPNQGALYPWLMGTAQKQFNLNRHFDLNLGVQAGYNLTDRLQSKTFSHFLYGLGVWHFKKGSRLVGGVYHSSPRFIGNGNAIGVMAGYELKLSKKFYLMGDWVSGQNEASVAVLGAMYNAGKRVQLCAGWQIPNPGTPKPMALVLELNLLGWNLY